jgi:ketopantoate reductase
VFRRYLFLYFSDEGNLADRVLVIGKGAIGVAVASRLKLLGYQPVFVGRKGPVDVVTHFKGWGQSFWLNIKKLSESNLTNMTACFVAVKAFDLDGATNRFAPYLQPGTPIITLSNGATQSITEKLQKNFPNNPVRLGFCTAGVTVVNSDHYELRSSKGGIFWGPLKAGAPITSFEEKLCSVKHDRFFNYLESVASPHRIKWLFNTVLNSICAVREHSRNGLLLGDVDYLKTVFDEAYFLGSDIWGGWSDSQDKLFNDMISLITSTKDNENSMYKDVRLRNKTETFYLAGLAKNSDRFPELCSLHLKILEKTPKRERVSKI